MSIDFFMQQLYNKINVAYSKSMIWHFEIKELNF
ncbi:hypothetical protein EUS_19640 [[Eubacterium] siraeum 70/3]|uniref:Uncharacterized protein n=1 Tax=[Eubacterium] siraeum 70/3 TaxID=657319 RepID=D4JV89_9FIRM|nr:hypothetical protein EUS_19640 [[Eubacterium] siraeum 70/3]